MKRQVARGWRAGLVAAAYILVLSGLQGGLAAVPAAAQTQTQQITDCTAEGSAMTQGTVAHAVSQGGTWTFACSGTAPFTIDITATLAVAPNTSVTLLGGQAVTLDGGRKTEIFSLVSTGSLTLEGLTLENGKAVFGGAINNGGMLAVSNSTFSGNTAFGGGAIDNGGTLTVSNSTFSNNTVEVAGGAIANVGGTLTVSGSTFSGNSASGPGTRGGAIANVRDVSSNGTVTVSDSTFSGNIAESSGQGGAIFNSSLSTSTLSTLKVSNSTFSGNGAGQGGNLYGGGTLNNTIVANPTSGGNCSAGSGASYGGTHDLQWAGTSGSDVSCAGTSTGVWTTGDPELGSLADNGGPTQTIALAGGSAALGAGAPGICASAPVDGFDQRGVARGKAQGTCDIGAYQGTAPSPSDLAARYVMDPSPAIAPPASLSLGQTVTLTVYTETSAGLRAPYVPVYLSLTGGIGSASVGGTALGPNPQLFTSDANGYVPVQYTAGTAPAGGGTDALTVADSVYSPVALQATTSYDYGVPPQITTASNATFTVGEPGSFTVKTSGVPGGGSMKISDGNATLPTGVTFTDNGDGTATLLGTSAAGSVGTYHFTITASNGVGSPATQSFTLTVQKSPTTLTLTSQAAPVSLCAPSDSHRRSDRASKGCKESGPGFDLARGATVAGSVYIPAGTDTSVFGQAVTLTATVSTVASGAGVPTGTVTFTDGASTLGAGPVSVSTTGGVTSATLTVPASELPAGAQAITASYSGDANFQGSTARLTQRVEYIFVGPLPPLGGKATVEAGRTVPVAFTLLDARGRVVRDAQASLEVNGKAAVPQGRANRGDAFRFQDGRYVYLLNLGKQGVTGGSVVLAILPGDGTTHGVTLTVPTQRDQRPQQNDGHGPQGH